MFSKLLTALAMGSTTHPLGEINVTEYKAAHVTLDFVTGGYIRTPNKYCGLTKNSPSHAAQQRAAKKRKNLRARSKK